ncbi:hypothetical protein ACFYNW_30185 [Streptomyces virginiae]|uniref:hypothetical protein n=1 Tax=Streptomyces virginiae TaxID=1961 RepID=UPI0036E1C6EB
MHRAWISFVRTGDPNHPDLPPWRPYDKGARATMRFDAVVTALDDAAGSARLPHERVPHERVRTSAQPSAPLI